ncbi:imelysin family protein [Roseibium sp.]|uniref:imelysin family protein n=2 Tax=Roseibium sp. TaxID=1936156 RepID=UPI0032637800
MRNFLIAAAVLSTACLETGTALAADTYTANVRQVIDGYIRPATSAFARQASALPPTIDALCTTATAQTKEDFADGYRDVVTAFGGVSFLRFGPTIDDHRLDSLAFMPDARGIAQRQIRRTFAKKDPSITDPDQLSGKSVALQGLTALQLIAFNKDGDVVLGDPGEDRDYICSYASAIAQNVDRIATEIETGWLDEDGYSARLLNPGPDNGQIRTSKEAIETIFNALVTGLIIVKDQELLPTLGSEIKKAKAHRLPFSRSGDGRAYLIAELQGIETALRAAHFEQNLDEEFLWIPDSIHFEFANGIANLESLDAPIRQSLKNEKTYQKLTLLVITMNSLRDTIALELAGALGLSGGFNALDGD